MRSQGAKNQAFAKSGLNGNFRPMNKFQNFGKTYLEFWAELQHHRIRRKNRLKIGG